MKFWHPQGTQTAQKLRSFFDANLIEFSDDGDKQCIKINALFLRSWCYFSLSAVALLVGISKFKHKYATELQLSTRFPFHCQDRFLLWFKRGSENEVENSVEKVVPKGPQMDPKSCQKSIKACSGGVSKRDLKNGPSPGSGKVRFCYYLLHFSKVGGLKKDTFLGTILGAFGRQHRWNRGPDE